METKNICGKIPVELHEKVREELEGTEMTIPQFLQKVIEEHFMKKGVEKMEAKTLGKVEIKIPLLLAKQSG